MRVPLLQIASRIVYGPGVLSMFTRSNFVDIQELCRADWLSDSNHPMGFDYLPWFTQPGIISEQWEDNSTEYLNRINFPDSTKWILDDPGFVSIDPILYYSTRSRFLSKSRNTLVGLEIVFNCRRVASWYRLVLES